MMDQAATTRRNGYSLESDLMPIIEGKVALPNATQIDGDIARFILHYRQMHCGTADFGGKKIWNARFFLDYGQAGHLYGSGIAAWTEWKDGAYRVIGMTFTICEHKVVEDAGANHSRGWHPSHCERCGLDFSVDSGD